MCLFMSFKTSYTFSSLGTRLTRSYSFGLSKLIVLLHNYNSISPNSPVMQVEQNIAFVPHIMFSMHKSRAWKQG